MTTTKSHVLRELDARQYCTTAPYPSKSIMPHILPKNFSVIDRYSKGLFCGEFSKDGKYFYCACQSGEIAVYRVGHRSLENINTYMCRNIQWSIIDTKLSPDNKFIAYSSWSGNVHLFPFLNNDQYELNLGLSDTVLNFHSSYCAFALSFSHNGKELIAGTNDGKVIVFDLEAGTKAVSIDSAHIADVNSISFSNQTNHIIYSAADDGILKVWDRRILSESQPKPVSVFIGHAHGITYQDAKGDFRYILTNSKDQTIKLWDTRRPSQPSDLHAALQVVRQNSQLWDYRQTSSSKRLAQHHKYLLSKRSSFYTIAKDDSVQTYAGHTVSTTLIRAKFSPAYSTLQQYIYTGSATGKLYIYDITSGDIVFESRQGACHSSVVRDVAWHPYEPMIFTSSLDFTLGCTQLRDTDFSTECDGSGHMSPEEEEVSD